MKRIARALGVLLVLLACRAGAQGPALVGTWVQDEAGPVTVYARRFEFKPDGSYTFTFTRRAKGSSEERTLAREMGAYRVEEGNRLAMLPKASNPKSVGWRIEKDKAIGNAQLVMIQADGKLDVYYPK
jgi:hypothetical protein